MDVHPLVKKRKGIIRMENTASQIPFWMKYTLTVEEAAQYFRIGEGKLRRIISEDKNADYLLWNGNRPQFKRTLFERYVDRLNAI